MAVRTDSAMKKGFMGKEGRKPIVEDAPAARPVDLSKMKLGVRPPLPAKRANLVVPFLWPRAAVDLPAVLLAGAASRPTSCGCSRADATGAA